MDLRQVLPGGMKTGLGPMNAGMTISCTLNTRKLAPVVKLRKPHPKPKSVCKISKGNEKVLCKRIYDLGLCWMIRTNGENGVFIDNIW